VETTALRSPDDVTRELPLTGRAADVVYRTRQEIQAVLEGRDPRKLVIVGPCSIHDPKAALDYAGRLLELREQVKDALVLVMRVYFEKRARRWAGRADQRPHLDGTYDIPTGIRHGARPAARDCRARVAGRYRAARSDHSAVHRRLGELGARSARAPRRAKPTAKWPQACPMPVGFKNGTDGSLGVAINAMIAASRQHSFLGVDGAGRVGVVRTAGNPHCHIVLRGGAAGPNYGSIEVKRAAAALEKARVNPRVMIDASHDNSGKDPFRQPAVLADVGAQLREGERHILGVMLESHLCEGRQELLDKATLSYGQSITTAASASTPRAKSSRRSPTRCAPPLTARHRLSQRESTGRR